MIDTQDPPRQKESTTPSPGARTPGATPRTTRYSVRAGSGRPEPPRDATRKGVEAAAPPAKKVAVFVAHGMGQQIPFQTLDQVAEGLLRQEPGPVAVKPRARAVKLDDQWLGRIELHLRGNTESPVEAHVYEGYWAPLTEGKITARNVMSFLYGAGLNGIRNGSKVFQRWIFDRNWDFDSPIRVVFYLLIALATMVSLVAMNSTIALVSAARSFLDSNDEWLTASLFRDLTTTFNVVVAAMAVFGLLLVVATRLRGAHRFLRQTWGWITVGAFISVLFTVVLAGVALPLLLYGHVTGAPGAEALWPRLLPQVDVGGFNRAFDLTALSLILFVVLLTVGLQVIRILRGVVRDLGNPDKRWLTLLVTLLTVALAGLGVRLSLSFLDLFRDSSASQAASVAFQGLAWPLLAVASGFIRKVLIQYVGDVAIYADPYKLDRFFELRDEIRQCVQKAASAIYALKRQDGRHEYEQVFMVGHSLGSVVVYDVLNRLVLADEAAGQAMKVVDRTPLLLTFGSPLDKFAFLFANQQQNTSEPREALAAAMRPLVQDYRFRPRRWVNLHSPWDIISGPLEFYDDPAGAPQNPQRVENRVDPAAATLLAAHNEYWDNPALFDTLYKEVIGS